MDYKTIDDYILPMTARADQFDQRSGRVIKGAITDGYNSRGGRRLRGDPNLNYKEAVALEKLRGIDEDFRENSLDDLIEWTNASSYNGTFLRYDPDKQILYTTNDTKGTSMEDAVMYTIPNAVMKTPDGKEIPVGLLGSPLEYEKMVNRISSENDVSTGISRLYAITHEYVHLMSTMQLLNQNTLVVEGTTDFILLNYFTDKMNGAEDKGERSKYSQLAKIAKGRVDNYVKAGFIPPVTRAS